MIKRATAVIAAILLVTAPVLAQPASPDQVLVIYNADWTEDLTGTEPGQDSLEVARYYVAAHTCPDTGRKPYKLGLRNLDPDRLYLNAVDTRESSDDNPWGVKYVGPAPLRLLDGPPRAAEAGYGDQAPGRVIEKASTRAEYAVLFLPMNVLGVLQSGTERLTLAEEGRAPRELLQQRPGPGAVPWFRHGVQGRGMYVYALLRGHVDGEATLTFSAQRRDGQPPVSWSQRFAFAGDMPPADHRPEMPDAGGFAPRPASSESLRRLDPDMRFTGFVIERDAWQSVDGDKLTVVMQSGADGLRRDVLVDAGTPAEGIGIDTWPMQRGRRFVVLNMPPGSRPTGYFAIRIEAPKAGEEGETVELRHDHYVPQGDLQFDPTGPDGRRDDQDYLDHIETPIKRFLEDPANALPDGTLLRDHILYIAVCHGLPYRVATLHGITRGEPMNGFSNMGRGVALTQRLAMMYLRPHIGVQAVGIQDGGVLTNRIVASPTLLVRSAGISPYVLPGVFQPASPLPENVPHFSAALRRNQPADRFLYSASRIDGPTPQHAKAMVDASLYAAKYFTPQLGRVTGSNYQTAQQAAELARRLGFDVPEPWMGQPATYDRAALSIGLFGYGSDYLDRTGPVARRDDSAVHFAKGFVPGGWGYATRSYLGWKRETNPTQFGRYIGKMLEGGAALSCGAVGGAHDTSHSRLDDRLALALLTRGHRWGDVILRSTIYWHWVIEFFGDPLYTANLAETRVPDPIALANSEAVSVEWIGAFDSAIAVVSVDVGHSFQTPQFATVRAELWPAGDPQAERIIVENPLFATRPRVAISDLKPETGYLLRAVVTDPYGNEFDTEAAFGPLAVRSPVAADGVEMLVDRTIALGEPPERRRLQTWGHHMQRLMERGTIEVTFVAPDHTNTVPLVRGSGGYGLAIRRGSHVEGLQVGGARAACIQAARGGETVTPFVPGETYTLRAWYRKYPTTRQIALVKPDGTLVPLGENNMYGWKDVAPPARLELAPEVTAIRIWNDAPGPTPEAYRLYPERVPWSEVAPADTP